MKITPWLFAEEAVVVHKIKKNEVKYSAKPDVSCKYDVHTICNSSTSAYGRAGDDYI